jgi:hypothetical protein
MLMSLSLWTYDVVQEWRPVFEHDMGFRVGLALDSALDELASIDDTFPPILGDEHVAALTWLTDMIEKFGYRMGCDRHAADADIQLIRRAINNYMDRG